MTTEISLDLNELSKKEISFYLVKLTQQVYKQISKEITDETINDAVEYHLKDNASIKFQKYYLETVSDKEAFLSKKDFFREFRKQYSLRGVDNDCLKRLEKEKQEIIQFIEDYKLAKLYFDHFAKVELKRKDKSRKSDLGSFFTKLVHTFRPDEFCALDNPVKNYFGLDKESYFIAFLIVSRAYREWANENKLRIEEIKEIFTQLFKTAGIESERMTDIKLLDLIFWSKAQKKKSHLAPR